MKRVTTISSVAMAVALAVTLWMLSGYIGNASDPGAGAAAAPLAVSVQRSVARTITREIDVSARTEPNRVVELRTEMDGRVVELGAERGSRVVESQFIVSVGLRDVQA